MGRIIGAIVAVILVVILAASGWYYRPWSPYSPARITALDDPADYPVTFQRMDEILPSRPIEATNPQPLPEAIEPLDITYQWNGATRTLSDFMADAGATGLVVLSDGVIVGERYAHGADASTRFTSWSVAKSFVATLIAMGLHEGLIDSLDDPAGKYAPAYAGSAYGDTTLRQLLMMSAGVDFNEDYADSPDSDIRPFFFNAFILGRDVDEMAAEIRRNRPPGQDLHYVSPNTHVLSAVVRSVYGDTLASIVEDRIWGPLGMTSDASWLVNVDADRAIEIGYCCLQATTRDYARFGQFYLQDGLWAGERMLPEGWVETASRPQAPFGEPGPDARYAPRGYGLHFWLPPDPQGEFFMAGVYGQYVWMDTERNVVVAMNAGDPEWGAREQEAWTLFRAIADAVAAPDTAETAEPEPAAQPEEPSR
ncbi:class C beta-lactamase-related serine hydrolase [Marinicauda algicola]|uniref:Class C beta-lactamase-related serine hydrolase n=1 Tax=Marinicauda algicola TaxID=2029849 RepID=A0A4S2H4V1_9PROT|nr:serine hydrolase [Marinicauda algicola]TGY90573.1 class C beta-lactamase-related serine hydrolase [Marinicauda algicola]